MTAQELYAQLYDVSVPDWQGEIDFYRNLIARSPGHTNGVLEVACGTGRVAARLGKEGVNITGLDKAPELLDIARRKCVGMSNVRWVLGDMRTFDLGTQFGCVIIPGHAFQVLNTPNEQFQCLTQIKRHLLRDGLLVIHLDHQDFRWLAGLLDKKELVYEEGKIRRHPVTGEKYRQSSAWTLEPATQTAIVRLRWAKIDERERVVQTWEMTPWRLHCVFRFEMEHLLRRSGYAIEALYGDFAKSELTDQSGQMIWVARNA